MTIGVFDSGLGGLVMARAFRRSLPEHDFLYLGDTLHVPYGPRSADAIYGFTLKAVDYLFTQGCPLVLIACNTASANALRRLQQEYLPKYYPDRRILGVIVPTIEATIATGHKNIGLIGTAFTVNSGTYKDELKKIDPAIDLHARATPLLVPLAENNGLKYSEPVLCEYLAPLVEKNIDSLILGCTHYPLFRTQLEKILPQGVDIIAQDDVVPPKLVDYLERHPEIDQQLEKAGRFDARLTDVTSSYAAIAEQLFGHPLPLEKISL
jgi:glutamate racemase